MNALDLAQFNQLLASAPIKPRLKRELRFMASTSGLSAEDWAETELLGITDRSGNKGVLLLVPDDDIYMLPYELSKGLTNRQTGRAQAIICDFCRSWRSGSGAASISFPRGRQPLDSVSFLCCADLACSKHVRGKTLAARESRAQLREDITNEERIERLKTQLRRLVDNLQVTPLTQDDSLIY